MAAHKDSDLDETSRCPTCANIPAQRSSPVPANNLPGAMISE
jgi:hypothetical protein